MNSLHQELIKAWIIKYSRTLFLSRNNLICFYFFTFYSRQLEMSITEINFWILMRLFLPNSKQREDWRWAAIKGQLNASCMRPYSTSFMSITAKTSELRQNTSRISHIIDDREFSCVIQKPITFKCNLVLIARLFWSAPGTRTQAFQKRTD